MIEIEKIQENLLQDIAKAGDEFLTYLVKATGGVGDFSLLYILQALEKINLENIQRDTNNITYIQKELLLEILKLQAKTKFEHKINFASLDLIAQFKQLYPLTTYENYRSLIDRISRTGNFTEMVSEPITLFQETAGTTGNTKLIPRTNRLSLSFMQAFQASEAVGSTYYHGNKFTQDRLGLALIHTLPVEKTRGGIIQGTGTSAGFQDALNKYNLADKIISLKFSSPSSVFMIPKSETAYYCHLLFALQKDITFISANFASNILEAAQIIEEKGQSLVEDIYCGKINHNIDLNKSIRDEIEKILIPNPKRAKFIENELQKGTKNVFCRIWSQLRYIQCITTGSMRVYKENLSYYTGEIPFYSGIYGASEAWIGINLEPYQQTPAYTIIPRSAFFEFIPIENVEEEQPITSDLSCLEVGKTYEVVVTTIAGLCRYRMGDIVRCVGYYNQTPTVEFLYRKSTLLNLAGEKVSEDTIAEAIFTATDFLEKSCYVVDYTTCTEILSRPWKYIIYVEISGDSEILSNSDLYEQKIEQKISEMNQHYLTLRKAMTIGPIKVKLVQKNTFKILKSQPRFQKKIGVQFKMPRLLINQEDIDFFEKMVLK